MQITVTRDTSSRKDNFYHMGEAGQAYCRSYFNEFGFTLEDLQGKGGRDNRCLLNAGYYFRVAKACGVRLYYVSMRDVDAQRLSQWAGEPIGTLEAFDWSRKI